MVKKILTLVLALAPLSCHAVRDKVTYETEVRFTDAVVRRSAPVVHHYLLTQCTCADGHWTASNPSVTDASCAASADWWVTYTTRWSWHLGMTRYNGALTDVDPGPAPFIPTVTCALPEGE